MLKYFLLGIILELSSYAIAVFFVISYARNNWILNETFYKIEVDYTKWVTNLPAYTVCPTPKRSFIAKQLNRLMSSNESELIQFAKGLLRPAKRYCRYCESEKVRSRFGNDLKSYTEILSEPCESIFMECTWNGKPFQCCRQFHKIHTETGNCFSFNSAYSRESQLPQMTTSLHRPSAELVLELTGSVRVYVEDGKNLNFHGLVPKIRKGENAEIIYRFTEWLEDPSYRFVNRPKRNCTLMNEIELAGFDVYSESACKLRCKAIQQEMRCGCKHHLLPGFEKDCDLQGLICLDGITETKECDCLQECSKLEVSYVKYSVKKSSGSASRISISLLAPPTERIVLASRITPIDLIVIAACISRVFTEKSAFELLRMVYFKTKALTRRNSKK